MSAMSMFLLSIIMRIVLAWLQKGVGESHDTGAKRKRCATDASEVNDSDGNGGVEVEPTFPAKKKHAWVQGEIHGTKGGKRGGNEAKRGGKAKHGEAKHGGKKEKCQLKKHVIVESDAEEDLDETISHKSAHANLANATSYLNNNNESSEASSSADIKQEQTDTDPSGEEDLLNIKTILDVPVIREPPHSSQLRSIETSARTKVNQPMDLFSISDNNIEEWSSIPTHVHSWSSSVVNSVPQSSEYEADCTSGEDSDQYPPLDQGTGKKTLKAPAMKGRSLRHEATFLKEQPKVKDHKPKHENTPCLHKNWPEHASVVLAKNGGTPHLSDQDPLICFFLQDIICIETVNILKVNSWPEFQDRDTFRQEFLSAAVKCNSRVDHIADIELWLKQDPDFSARLGSMVLDCLPLVPKADEPFLNVAILEALKTIGHEAIIKYNNEIDNLDKPELPIAMVALGATAVYAALLEWVEGIKTSRSFDGNVFAIIYESHVETLEAFCARSTNTMLLSKGKKRINCVMDLSKYLEGT
ncbi:hypothetical protein BDQ17DRAFT_1329435 [Cyathus striatus]|nr:hypothetical protein BDQ17DRAFT_1329435 [Cyathus striatus]